MYELDELWDDDLAEIVERDDTPVSTVVDDADGLLTMTLGDRYHAWAARQQAAREAGWIR